MVRFWDASALVPLVVDESRTPDMRAIYNQDAEIVVWWATPVECAAALARVERQGILLGERLTTAHQTLDRLAAGWLQIEPHDDVREIARRLLRVHRLRAADALQLAAAIMASEGRPSTMAFVTLDDRLGVAASKEGFQLLPSSL
jgi:uncharacterized protein